jgi:hypothetical protein
VRPIKEPVTSHLVIPVFLAGAGALALWVDVRFPRLGPTELRGVVLHAICAYGLFLASGVFFDAAAGDVSWRRFSAVFAIELPSLVYMLIVCLWMLKLVRGAISMAR